ncbi:MAG TPA: hypothetical protein VJU53_08680 [Burkholderiaceae bacterium]|nr:hypothetical protein [Burkholderiaceae bacterium]
MRFQAGKKHTKRPQHVPGNSPAIQRLKAASGACQLGGGAGVGRSGLVLLIDGCCFVGGALSLALALLILLFLTRDLALALLK